METEEKIILGSLGGIMAILVLMQFIRTVTPQPQGDFACPYCTQRFNTLDELVNHVAIAHPDQPPIQPIDIGWS
jgi:hypothetical protein